MGRKSAAAFLCVAALAAASPAQSRFRLDIGDAAYWAGAGIGSTVQNKRSRPSYLPMIPSSGRTAFTPHGYSPGKSLAAKAAVWGGIEAAQAKWPKARRALFWGRIGLGVAWGLAAFRNPPPRQPSLPFPIVP